MVYKLLREIVRLFFQIFSNLKFVMNNLFPSSNNYLQINLTFETLSVYFFKFFKI